MKTTGQFTTPKVKIKKESPRSDGSCAIYIQFYINKEQIRVPTGLSVSPGQWSAEKQRLIGRSREVNDANLIIQDCLARINQIAVECRLENRTLNREQFLSIYHNSNVRTDFLAFWEHWLHERKKTISRGTWRHEKACLNKIRKWRSSILFSEISDHLFKEYKAYLRHTLKNKPNTIGTSISKIKIYLHLAKAEGYHFTMPKHALKKINVRSDRTFLTEEELRRAINLWKSRSLPPTHQSTLQNFLFSCFTGLRYRDAKDLTEQNIIIDWLVYAPHKTKDTKGEQIKLKLGVNARQFLQAGKKPLPELVRNNYANDHLRGIFKMLGVRKKITYHCSRHTFATLFLVKGGNVLKLQQYLGHSNIRETMVYVHIMEEHFSEETLLLDAI